MKLVRFKELKSIDKFIILNILLLAILLVLNIAIEIAYIAKFEERKAAGNARWEQIEDRILRYEDKIDLFIELTDK